MFVYLLARY